MNQTLTSWASLVGSLLVHTWVFLGSEGEAASPRLPTPATVVRLSVAPSLPEPTPAEPAPEPAPEPPKRKPVHPRPAPKMPEPAPQLPEPAPELPEPERELPEPEVKDGPDVEPPEQAPAAELTGETLVSNTGQGFAAPVGNGKARHGAIPAGFTRGSRRSPVAVKNATARKARGGAVPVPLSQLSKRPEPPPLTRALERNYPPEARNLGRSGEATVRARIESDGALRVAKVTFETAQGFGDACRTTLLSSKWSVPLDRQGKPASTWVTYQCTFRIGR